MVYVVHDNSVSEKLGGRETTGTDKIESSLPRKLKAIDDKIRGSRFEAIDEAL